VTRSKNRSKNHEHELQRQGSGRGVTVPHRFDGKAGQNIDYWLGHFENWYKQWNLGFEDPQVIGDMLSLVGLPVQRTWQLMPEESQFDWEAVKEELRESWSLEKIVLGMRDDFWKRKQGANEEYAVFMNELMRLAQKGWSEDNHYEDRIRQQFLMGIRDVRVRRQMNTQFQFDPIETIDRPHLVKIAENAHWVVRDLAELEEDRRKFHVRRVTQNRPIPLPTQKTKKMRQDRGSDITRYPSVSDWREPGEASLCYGCAQAGHRMEKCEDPYLMDSEYHVKLMFNQIVGPGFRYICRDAGIMASKVEPYVNGKGKKCTLCKEKGHLAEECMAENMSSVKGKGKDWKTSMFGGSSQSGSKVINASKIVQSVVTPDKCEDEQDCASSEAVNMITDQLDDAMDLTMYDKYGRLRTDWERKDDSIQSPQKPIPGALKRQPAFRIPIQDMQHARSFPPRESLRRDIPSESETEEEVRIVIVKVEAEEEDEGEYDSPEYEAVDSDEGNSFKVEPNVDQQQGN
jgi:hypothetical protein